jgi:hypothetical protein
MDFARLVRRDGGSTPIPHSMLTLLIVLLILLILTLLLVATLLFMRQRRRARRAANILPMYDEKRLSTSTTSSHHRRVMVRPSESVYVYQEKQDLIDNSSSPPSPTNAIPEIRITFPEEFDDMGKRKSGRVVVVRVGDTSIGLEPVVGDEKLPTYGEDDERFHSVDLDRVGGLVEKARNNSATWKEVQ